MDTANAQVKKARLFRGVACLIIDFLEIDVFLVIDVWLLVFFEV
jgi:hypothetical protein